MVVADEESEPEVSAATGIVNPSSLSCRGALLALGNFTFCNTTEKTFNVK